MGRQATCGWALEEAARSHGARCIAGVDEVGRGPLFGPVVAAAVVLPAGCALDGLNDSKQLTERKRNEFDSRIRACALAFALSVVDAETIDRINIRQASLLAMRCAVEQLAKVHRDRMLVELDRQFPGYGLARHKGYGSAQHREALARLGPTPLHRKSFQCVAQAGFRFER